MIPLLLEHDPALELHPQDLLQDLQAALMATIRLPSPVHLTMEIGMVKGDRQVPVAQEVQEARDSMDSRTLPRRIGSLHLVKLSPLDRAHGTTMECRPQEHTTLPALAALDRDSRSSRDHSSRSNNRSRSLPRLVREVTRLGPSPLLHSNLSQNRLVEHLLPTSQHPPRLLTPSRP